LTIGGGVSQSVKGSKRIGRTELQSKAWGKSNKFWRFCGRLVEARLHLHLKQQSLPGFRHKVLYKVTSAIGFCGLKYIWEGKGYFMIGANNWFTVVYYHWCSLGCRMAGSCELQVLVAMMVGGNTAGY